jgi:hypothetical protein
MIRLLVLIAIWCGVFAGTAFAGCAGKIVSVNAQGPLTYSPFAAWNAQQRLTLTVQNTGTLACSYQVSIPASFYPLQFGGKLSFSVSSTSALGGASANFTTTTPALSPGKSAQLVLLLTVSRGQLSLSGRFTSNVGFALAGAGSPLAQSPIDQVIIPLVCTVPPVFEINLAGSGRKTTVQFASLEAGQKTSVILQTRTNGGHNIEFRSVNGGFLALQGHGGPASTIPYAAAVDGQPVALSAPAALSFAAEPGEASRRLTVTIGDTSGKLAGTYIDVITVSILSSM